MITIKSYFIRFNLHMCVHASMCICVYPLTFFQIDTRNFSSKSNNLQQNCDVTYRKKTKCKKINKSHTSPIILFIHLQAALNLHFASFSAAVYSHIIIGHKMYYFRFPVDKLHSNIYLHYISIIQH